MEGFELPVRTADELLRVVRVLGKHRYVSGRLLLVHAAAFVTAFADDASAEVADALRWARAMLHDATIDASSRDERLLRRATEAELCAVLERFWVPGANADAARARLRAWLLNVELPMPEHAPFHEEGDEAHPLLVDAGWELFALTELDGERHRGAIEAFGEPFDFECARFEDESAIPKLAPLHELPAIGPRELCDGVDGAGVLQGEVALWTCGNAIYQDYVLRGVLRAARVAPREA